MVQYPKFKAILILTSQLLLIAACQGVPQSLQDLATLPEKPLVQEKKKEDLSPLLGFSRTGSELSGNLAYARQQFFLKHYDVAEYYLKKALLHAPDHKQALLMLPWSQFFQKRFDLALISFSNAHAHFKRDSAPLTGMAWCYFAMGFYEQAVETFDRASRFSPDSFQIAKGRGWTYFLLKRTEEAHQEFEKIYTERERLANSALWDQWQEKGLSSRVPVIASRPDEESLFTLPGETPRYPSLLFVWGTRPHNVELEEAWRLYRKENYSRALKLFHELPSEVNDSLDARNGLAWSLLKTGNLLEAQELFHDILKQYPEFDGGLEGLTSVQAALKAKARVANHYLDVKKYRIAEAHFEELAGEFTQWSHPPARLGLIALQEGRESDAVDWFDRALKLNPNDQDALNGLDQIESEQVGVLFKAERARREGNAKPASYLYWEYIESRGKDAAMDKHLAQAYNGLAWVQYEKGLYDLAYENFDRLLDFPEYNFEIAKGKGLSLYQLGEYEEAVEMLTLAERLEPDDIEVAEALDWSVLQSTDLMQAEQYFISRLGQRPRLASSYMALGWVYYQGANADLGVEYFLKSISLKPELALNAEFIDMLKQERFGWQIYTRLGWEYYHRHDYDLARRLFQAALLREANSSEALKGMGYAYFRQGKLELAEDFLRRSLEENHHPLAVEEILTGAETSSPVIIKTSPRTLLGHILLQQERPDDALAVFLDARQEHPDWPEISDGLGWAYLKLGRLTESRAAFNKAIRFQPLHPKAHQGLHEVKRRLATQHL